MKTFTLKSYPSKKNADGIDVIFDPKIILHGIVVRAPQGHGFTLDIMRKRLRIAEVLENTEGLTISLEDADYTQLCEIINTFPTFIGGEFIKEVVETCDIVLKAKDSSQNKNVVEAA